MCNRWKSGTPYCFVGFRFVCEIKSSRVTAVMSLLAVAHDDDDGEVHRPSTNISPPMLLVDWFIFFSSSSLARQLIDIDRFLS